MTQTTMQSNGTADATKEGASSEGTAESRPLVASLADVCDALPACDELGDRSICELADLPAVGDVARAVQLEIRRVAAGLETAETLIDAYPWPESLLPDDDQAAAQHALESLAAARAALDTLRENLFAYLACSAFRVEERLVGLDSETVAALGDYLAAVYPLGVNPLGSVARLVNAGARLMIDLKPHTWPEHGEPQSCEISPAVRRWVAGFNAMRGAIAEAEGAVAALAIAEGGAR